MPLSRKGLNTLKEKSSFDPARFLPIDRTRLWYLLRMLRHDPGALLRAGPLRRALVQTDADPYAAAIRFMAWHPQVLTSLFGTSSLGHAAANLANAKRQLTVSEWQTLAARLNAPGFAHD